MFPAKDGGYVDERSKYDNTLIYFSICLSTIITTKETILQDYLVNLKSYLENFLKILKKCYLGDIRMPKYLTIK